ncbi:MAG: hypothetical protein OHK0046_12830 [Anaerolineae bacterium]
MATSREVQTILQRFTAQLKNANDEVERLLKVIKELEKALENYDDDADLDITRGIKAEIERGKAQISELRDNVAKLDRELADTNRKYQNLSR